MSRNFTISGPDGVAITAGAVSAAVLIASTPAAVAAEDVMIDNPGPADVYVRAGATSGVAATTSSMRVPAGSMQAFAKGAGNAWLATITAGASQAVVVFCGDGQ